MTLTRLDKLVLFGGSGMLLGGLDPQDGLVIRSGDENLRQWNWAQLGQMWLSSRRKRIFVRDVER